MTRKRLSSMVRSLGGGGMERSIVELANGFAERGHHSTLLVGVADGPTRQEIAPGVRLIALPKSTVLSARWWLLRTAHDQRWALLPLLLGSAPSMLQHAAGLVRHLQSEPIDALLSIGTQSNLVALWARRVAGVACRVVVIECNTLSAVVAHAQHAFRRAYPALIHQAYRDADAIIAMSLGVAADLAKVADIPPERIVSILNPVVSPRLEAQSRERIDHPWFADGNVPLILGVGRLHRQKDFPTLLRAFARVRATTPARLLILGEGEERGRLEALARQLGISDDTVLEGYVANPFPWMARARVFVLSSRYEGNGNVILEAMACGCPVVSTDCPNGPHEILQGGACGRLVPVGDDGALADAILATLRSPPDIARLRARAADYDRDASVDRYLEIVLG